MTSKLLWNVRSAIRSVISNLVMSTITTAFYHHCPPNSCSMCQDKFKIKVWPNGKGYPSVCYRCFIRPLVIHKLTICEV